MVAISPDLDRTVAALGDAGLDLRRIREEPTPAGAPARPSSASAQPILEVVQEPAEAIERAGGDRPAFFWGLAFVAPDLDATVASLGDRVSEIRDAVQPGRRIATLRRSAGLSLPVALITPPSRIGRRRTQVLDAEAPVAPQARRDQRAVAGLGVALDAEQGRRSSRRST